MMIGCGETDNSTTSAIPPQEYNKTFTLQGKVMDAITGAPIGNDATGTLSMFLIQGDFDRGPTKLHTAPNDPLVGEYSFSGIPADRNVGEVTYKVVVRREGYQDFAANVTFSATIANVTISHNGTLNMIGNIYLFPIGSAPGDVSIVVRDPQGTPIPNAAVLLQQNVTGNGVTAIPGNRLVPVAGVYTSMTATTNADGSATFSSANLVLGGSYIAQAEALTFQGEQLATTSTAAFIVGTNSSTQVVNMAPTGSVLFATSASNQVPGTITPTGVLSVTFNQPIALSTAVFTATITGGGQITDANGVIAATGPVNGVLSNNNTTLTITPTISTAPTAAGATISYAFAGQIILQNSQTVTGSTLFTGAGTDVVNISTGAAVSGTVLLISN
jgi:hypothetical protein